MSRCLIPVLQKMVAWLAAVPLLAISSAAADVIEKKDGEIIHGTVRSETASEVIVEVSKYGAVGIVRISLSEIKSITRTPAAPARSVSPRHWPTTERDSAGAPSPKGPRYFPVALRGIIGKEITAAKMRECLLIGLQDRATVLVLDIHSPGGYVAECNAIIDLLADYRDRRSIAVIREALSAAAVVALTCDEIYMTRKASIGAAQSGTHMPWGWSPAEEKFQSVWRAKARVAAETGGHNPLLAEAMIDADVCLRTVGEQGKRDVEQVRNAQPGSSRDMLSPRGKLLTLTGREAVECGLAAGVLDSPSDLFEAAGLAGAAKVSDEGVTRMAAHASLIAESERQLSSLLEEVKKLKAKAIDSDPGGRTYLVDAATRRMTPESEAEWKRRSAECIRHLEDMEKLLAQAWKIANRTSYFQREVPWISEHHAVVKRMREAVEKDKARRYIAK